MNNLSPEDRPRSCLQLVKIDAAVLVRKEKPGAHAHRGPCCVIELFEGEGSQIGSTSQEGPGGGLIPGPEEDFRFVGRAGIATERERSPALGIPEPVSGYGAAAGAVVVFGV